MKKKEWVILSLLLAVVLILGGTVWLFAARYQAQGLALVDEREGEYTFNGKILVSSDGSHALYYKARGRELYHLLPRKDVSLSPYGFEGESFSYYEWSETDEYLVTDSVYYAAADGYEGFWPVCGHEKAIYLAEDGSKFRIHLDSGLSYPMFSDSIEGVDIYGKEVLAFSANASYAVSLKENTVTVYHTDPMDDSLRIVDTKTVDLSPYGSEAVFGAFVGNKEAYFRVKTKDGDVFVALDCESGKSAKSLLSEKIRCGEILSRTYGQRLNFEDEEGKKRIGWANLILGTEFFAPEGSLPEDTLLFAVSGKGGYALGKSEESGEIYVISEKRVFSLSSVLPEKSQVTAVDFVYENMLAVRLTNENGDASLCTYKICF